MTIETAREERTVTIPGLLQGTVEAIRGRDRDEPVLFQNIYNQIHDSTQVIARGSTRYEGDVIRIDNSGTHGLWSSFRWTGDA